MTHDDRTQNLYLPMGEGEVASETEPSDAVVSTEQAFALPEAQPEAVFRLMNIHLIDSLSRGRVQTMSIDGGTALTGRNGQGKTSLLSLALIFAGVEPKDVVSQGKDSFVDYYLPNQTSYIVYEYERPNGDRRLAVAYSNSTAERVYFRFVKSPFLREMFVTDDGQFVLAKEFRRRLVELKIQHADRQIETYIDFRCIIQGWQPLHADATHRRLLAALSADYAFTNYNKSLRHLEKLTKGMFSRKANFDDLQQVVADLVFEGKPSIGIQTERGRVENWPRDHSAYQNIMKIAPLVDEAIRVRLDLEDAEEGLQELKEKFEHLKNHLELLSAQRGSERESLQQFFEKKKSERDFLAETLNNAIHAAKAEIDQCNKALHAIELERVSLVSQDVEQKRTQSGQREMFVEELRRVEKRYDLALGAASDIKSRYDLEINEENSRHIQFCAVATEEIQRLGNLERSESADTEQRHADARQSHADSSNTVREKLQRDMQGLSNQLGRDQERAKNPVVDPAIDQAIEEKNDSLSEAAILVGEIETQMQTQERAITAIQLESSNLDQAIEKANVAFANQLDAIEKIKLANSPEEDSLLQFLRLNRPDWSANIAKVINPALLYRTDLHPQLSEISDSLYGISMELEYVDPVHEADDSKLQEMLSEASIELDALQSQLERLKENMRALRQEHKSAQVELGVTRSKLTKARTNKQNIESDLARLKTELRNCRDASRKLAEEALAETQRKLNSSTNAYNEFLDRLGAELKKIDGQAKHEREKSFAKYIQATNDVKGEISAHRESTDLAIRELKTLQNQKLAEEGADVSVIEKLEDQKQQLSDKISEIDGWRDLLNRWQHWLEREEPKIASLDSTKSLAQAVWDEKSSELQATHSAWARTQSDIESKIKECVNAIHGCTEKLLVIENALTNQLARYESTNRFNEYDSAWQSDSLKSSMGNILQRLDQATKELGTKVRVMRAAFISTPLAPPSTYLQDRLANIRDESSGVIDDRVMLQVIEDWFANHHDKSRRLLIADAHTIFGEIQGLHRELKSFSEKITRFNTGLQDHLTHSSKVFDSITNLKISIFSAVEDLDYWKIISKITDDREQWQTDGALPNESAVDNLLALLGHWDIKSGINANFKSLVSIRGSVEEKNNLRQFRNRTELENVSSNGLSYLILIILFLGFISKVRGNSPVQLTWCVDELKAIDADNVISLCKYLGENHITLCTAFPDPDAETLILFENKYKLDSERRLVHCELVVADDLGDDDLDLELESA